MNTTCKLLVGTALCGLMLHLDSSLAQGTAFTYQGRLESNNSPADGTYNLVFTLFSANSGGTALAPAATNNDVIVSNGLFTVTIDFGLSPWNGGTNWLQIGVETNGAGSFTTLVPRQELTPSPYAIFAESVNAAGINGTYTNQVNFNNGANSFSGTFYGDFLGADFIGGDFSGAFIGDGSGLIHLNASQLSSGTIPSAALGNAWKTTGNAGTTAGPDFVGTTDYQPLELHVNGQRALALYPDTSTNNSPNILGGSPVNTIAPGLVGATISGGGAAFYSGSPGTNQILGDFNTIGGGWGNVTGSTNFDVTQATVGGGAHNTASGISSTIGGGADNVAYNNDAAIAGGFQNRAGFRSDVAGGNANAVDGDYSDIGGGYGNDIQTNILSGTIAGGIDNSIQGNFYEVGAVIGGGAYNTIFPASVFDYGNPYGTNYASSYSVIGGGYFSQVQSNSVYSVIGGGYVNFVDAQSAYSVIAGGGDNSIYSYANGGAIGGGEFNHVGGFAGTVPGGFNNLAGQAGSFAAGTYAMATNSGSFVLADYEYAPFYSTTYNQLSARFIGGIRFVTAGAGITLDGVPLLSSSYTNPVTLNNPGNTLAGNGAAIANVNALSLQGLTPANFWQTSGNAGTSPGANYLGTSDNQPLQLQVNGARALRLEPNSSGAPNVIGGSPLNYVTPGVVGATISGGGASSYFGAALSNSVTANFGTVSGGSQNTAASLYATVCGGISNVASAPYTFTAGTSAKATHQGVFVWADSQSLPFEPYLQTGPGGLPNSFNARSLGGFCFVTGIDTNGYGTSGVYVSGGGSGWNTLSDRNAKTNFQQLDPQDVLARLAQVPVMGWNYKSQDESTRHIGPMAQDFNAAFGVGEADKAGERKYINSIDEEGVALAAIQGLNQKVIAKDAEIQGLKQQNEALEKRLARLEQIVSTLNQK